MSAFTGFKPPLSQSLQEIVARPGQRFGKCVCMHARTSMYACANGHVRTQRRLLRPVPGTVHLKAHCHCSKRQIRMGELGCVYAEETAEACTWDCAPQSSLSLQQEANAHGQT